MPNPVDARRRALLNFMTTHSLSARALCRHAKPKLSPAVVTQFLNDPTRDMIARTWAAIAIGASELVGRTVSVAELQGEAAPPYRIDLQSYVGAGARVFPIDGDGAVEHDITAPPGFEGVAMIVKGDSGLPLFEDGDILFVMPAERDVARFVGRVAVVQVKDGPRLVKRVLRGSRKGRYTLQSLNPPSEMLEDQVVVEAAHVRWISRPG